jgi:hypothetical protein
VEASQEVTPVEASQEVTQEVTHTYIHTCWSLNGTNIMVNKNRKFNIGPLNSKYFFACVT